MKFYISHRVEVVRPSMMTVAGERLCTFYGKCGGVALGNVEPSIGMKEYVTETYRFDYEPDRCIGIPPDNVNQFVERLGELFRNERVDGPMDYFIIVQGGTVRLEGKTGDKMPSIIPNAA